MYGNLKAKNSLLELEIDFKELENNFESKNKNQKKRNIEEMFFKPIIVSYITWIDLKRKK